MRFCTLNEKEGEGGFLELTSEREREERDWGGAGVGVAGAPVSSNRRGYIFFFFVILKGREEE